MNRFRPSRFLPFLGLAFLASCASHSGQFSESHLAGPVEYRSVAMGRSSVTRVLGFGGASRRNLLLEARKDMLQSHPLKDGESFANTTLDINESNYLLFSTTTFTLAADVVASLTDNAARVYSREYSRIMAMSDSVSGFPATGDTVMTENGKLYLLVTRSSDGSAGVLALPDDGTFKIARLPIGELFATHGERLGIAVGDTLEFNAPVQTKRYVVGLGQNEVLTWSTIVKFRGNTVQAGGPSRLLYGEIDLDPDVTLQR